MELSLPEILARYRVAFDAWAKLDAPEYQLFSKSHYEKLWASAFLALSAVDPANIKVRASVRNSSAFEPIRTEPLFPQQSDYSVQFIIRILADKTQITRLPVLATSPKRVNLIGLVGVSNYTTFCVPRSLYDVDPEVWESLHRRLVSIWETTLGAYDWKKAARKALAHYKKQTILAGGEDTPARRAKTKIAHDSFLAHMLKKELRGRELSAEEFVRTYRLLQTADATVDFMSRWISINSVSSQYLSDQDLLDVHASVMVHKVHLK